MGLEFELKNMCNKLKSDLNFKKKQIEATRRYFSEQLLYY